MSLFKKEISNCIQKEGTKEWQENPTCRMTKIFYPNLDKSKAKQLLNLLRKKSRRLIEAITWQNNLHYVQNKIKKTEKLCRLCEEEEETFDHFVNDCPCLRLARQDHFGLHKIERSHRWTIQGILGYSRIKAIDSALRGEDSSDCSTDWKRENLNGVRFQIYGLTLGNKLAMESWQVDANNGSGQKMPKGLGTWEVLTSFPLGPCGDPYPTNKQTTNQPEDSLLKLLLR